MSVTNIQTIQEYESRDYLDVHNVRIRPSKIVFKNAYEGRSFKAKLTIQNIGTARVQIQIASPSSYAFHIKTMKCPTALSPGLSMNRTVAYTFSYSNVNICQIPIRIDKHTVDFQIIVEVVESRLCVSPTIIEFGTIDVGLTSSLKVLRLRNDGNIPSSFYIDIPKEKPRLMVDPIRGQVLAKSFIDVNIKLVSCAPLCLKTEIWIKCKTPIRVPVTGEIIDSLFEPIHPLATESFTVLDFPPTYYGVKSTMHLLVRNYSSVSNMFCVMGEIKHQSTPLEKCADLLYYHKYFHVSPTEGRFTRDETKLFQFVFEPKKRRGPDLNPYYVCGFLIHRVRCQDIMSDKYPDGIFIKPNQLRTPLSDVDVTTVGEAYEFEQNIEEVVTPNFNHFEASFVRVYLHALPEEPSVIVIPTDLTLNNLTLGVKQTRALELKNGSSKLPIILQYKKVAFIELEKDAIFLQPNARVQLAVHITPFKCGPVSAKISFNMLFYDCPKASEDCYSIIGHLNVPVRFDTFSVTKYPKIELNPGLDPNYIRSVGIYCHGIQFNTSLKNCKCITVDNKLSRHHAAALVAFPNDTQQSLRPWRSSAETRTIFSNQPRYIPPLDTAYEVTITDLRLKQELDIFYRNYIRTEAERLKQMSIKQFNTVTDYALTIGTKLLCNDTTSQVVPCKFKIAATPSHCVSLTPAQMNNITISPTLIETGSIAAKNPYNFNIWITNNNPLLLNIFVRPDKPSLMFPQGNRFEVKAHSTKPIPTTFESHHIGYFMLALDIVVNECMLVTVAVLANVVPSTIILPCTEIVFKDDVTYHYFDLKNGLNVPITFEWIFSDENFTVSPRRGLVPENRCITCIIRYLPYIEGNLVTDFELITDDTNSQTVKLISTVMPSDVVILTTEVEFKNLSLNRPAIKKIFLENRHSFPVGFRVLDCGLGDTILIAPTTYVVPPQCQTSILVRIQMPYCVTFQTNLRFRIINSDIIEIPIIGNVVYPEIIIRPDIFQFKKLIATKTQQIRFTVTNKSKVVNSIKFMNDTREYRISEGDHYWSPTTREEYELDKGETKAFFLHFIPLEMTAMTFYLPIVINGILGPPIYSDPVTARVNFYLKECPSLCETIPLPIRVPCIKIIGFATEPKIQLSKLILHFVHYPQIPHISRNTNKVILTNNQSITENICFRTDYFEYPFNIERIDATTVKYLDKAILITLLPKAQAVLNFSFHPHEFCKVESFLPFYLKSESTMNSHAMLYLTGKYEAPTIMGEKTVFYSRPYPLQYTAINSKIIKFQNHFKGCKVFTYTDLSELKIQIKFNTYTKINESEYEMELVFKTVFPNSVQFCNIIKVFCTCGSVWQTNIIGCAENCLLTNYAFADTFLPTNIEVNVGRTLSRLAPKASAMSMFDDVSRKIYIEEEFHTSAFFTSYPLFPLDDMFETQEYVDEKLNIFLLGVVEAVESWYWSQAMFGTVYYVIPQGINCSYLIHDENKTLKDYEVPLINGLINLVGPQFNNLLPTRPASNDPVEEAYFLYQVFDCVISFLKDLGAFFTYLQPEFLLPFPMFDLYKRYIFPKQEKKSPITMKIKSVTIFYYLSKQSWCDVLLQTYKVLYLFRLQEQANSKLSQGMVLQTPMRKYRSSVKNLARNCNIFSNSELVLINWLEFHYCSMKKELWKGHCYKDKEVNFFGKDLRDGLVFAAVTATYCPYLRKYYEDMYMDPVGRDQLFHNNLIVIRCWDMLHYTYKVTPEDLIQPNCIKILMLVAYLYDVLPFMHPIDEINFETKLSLKTPVQITLNNINEFTIAYDLIIFDDPDKVFGIPTTRLVIPPKDVKKLPITYYAKFAKAAKAYILLNGECPGYHYAKCKCLTLTALPNITDASSTYNLTFPLYSFRRLELTVQCPYKQMAVYSLKILSENQLTYKQLEDAKYVTEVHALPFSRVVILNPEFQINSDGIGIIEATVCFGYFISFPIYLFFLNPTIGDFMIRLNTVARPPKICENFKVQILKKNRNLPMQNVKGIFVEIPNKNYSLWQAMRQHLVELSAGNERKFWEKNMRSSIGIHLMQKLWAQDLVIKDYAGLYYHKKIFSLTVLDNKDISLPSEITIEDDWSTGTVRIPIKFLPTCNKFPKSFSFRMHSTDGLAIRNCDAEFVFVDSDQEFLAPYSPFLG